MNKHTIVAFLLFGLALAQAQVIFKKTYVGSGDQVVNPERGFRWERDTYIQPATTWQFDLSQNLTVSQVYSYLGPYIGQSIPQTYMDGMNAMFSQLRANGMKVLLRFAYEDGTANQVGPSNYEQIFQHISQLAPLVQNNSDVLYALQMGFVGEWGEWHGSVHNLEANTTGLALVAYKVLYELLPPSRQALMRLQPYKADALAVPMNSPLWNNVQVSPKTAYTQNGCARIGYHDDSFQMNLSDGGTFNGVGVNLANSQFDYWKNESAYVPIDGELLWTQTNLDNNLAIQRLHWLRFTTFSMAHSYSFTLPSTDAINVWQSTPLDLNFIKTANMPISPSYAAKAHTYFDYVRDHLGYRYELNSASFPAAINSGNSFTLTYSLTNYGFSAMINKRSVIIAFINSNNHIAFIHDTGVDPRIWQPYDPADSTYTLIRWNMTTTFTIPSLAAGTYSIGIWMPDAAPNLASARYCVRFANADVGWYTDASGNYGVNILGTLSINTASTTTAKLQTGYDALAGSSSSSHVAASWTSVAFIVFSILFYLL